jgi:hypothetical protein
MLGNLLLILLPIGVSLALLYTLWGFYLAVMNLVRVKDQGKLTKVALYLGYPLFIIGGSLDILINWIILTIALLEIPRELTVTSRLSRYNKIGSGWRYRVAVWFAVNLLDPYDPSGKHIK